MWPYDYINPMAPYFQATKAAAAHMPQPGEHGNYGREMFAEDFPQFFKVIPPENEGQEERKENLVPKGMLQLFIDQANESVLSSRWGGMWRYAAGLYVAHFCALYLKTYAPSSESAGQAAGSSAQVGVVKTATMGDTSISYDNSAITTGTEKWGAWNSTQYGLQLVTMARQVGLGGVYVI